MNKRVLTEKEFAEMCGISYGYLKILRRNKKVKYLKVGRKVLYLNPEHVEEFLKSREQRTSRD